MRLTRRQSLILSGCVVASFFIASLLLHSAQQRRNNIAIPKMNPSAQATATLAPKAVDLVMGKFHRYETKDGRKLWEIISEEGHYDPTTQSAQLKQPKLWFYKSEDDVMTASSKRADVLIQDGKLGDVKLFGDITLTANDLKLTTRKASMKGDSKHVTVPGSMTIEKPGLFLQGRTLHADLEKKEFTLEHDVVTKIGSPADKVEPDETFHRLSASLKKPKKNTRKNKKIKKRNKHG